MTARLDPYRGEPVPEGSYDPALKRAFETACQLHDQLLGEDLEEGFDSLAPIVSGYSTTEPSARRV
ncbi:MAG: hypothetical protein WAM82_04485 [Thermoanaerobaculia bacterium]